MLIIQILFILLAMIFIGIISIHLNHILFHKKAPFFPSKKEIPQEVLGNIECSNGDKIYELGCGTGTFLKILRNKYPHKKLTLTGVENFTLPLILLKLQNKLTKYNINIRNEDVFQTNLSEADIIYCFLNVEAMKKLRPRIFSECRPGTQIISYQFRLPQATPEKVITSSAKDYVFIYKI